MRSHVETSTQQVRSQDLERVSRKVVGAACAIVLLHTALVFAGWAFRDPWLINFPFPSRYSTTPLTAVGLLLCSMVLWLRRSDEALTSERRWTAWLVTTMVVLLGALVLWEYAFSQDPGIDRLLFPESVTALLQTFPGRPPLATGLALVAVGVALACLDVKS
ncbi:MAG TPA: hypothetical protein VK864_05130, partial [Longimicrobiales bacterium]|nr:hypothetical protein [Longimicrobiales bacterium]